ncbi:MAG: hypothetical protein AAGL49_04110 [Pseudomonadota bacterium]
MRSAQVLLTVVALCYTVAPPLVDFNPTHALHPDWPAHARFHMVWLVIANSLLGLLAIHQIWWRVAQGGVFVGGAISTFILGAFLLSAVFMPLYGGALTDEGGVAPGPGGVDLNLTLFGTAFGINALGLVWARSKTVA